MANAVREVLLQELSIIFLSYNESNSEKNWEDLSARFPRAKRVRGVKGIREAHQKAAEVSETDSFFIVDGDNRIKKDFIFKTPFPELRTDTIYVYRCHVPVNDLVYGYGAVKIYNKSLLLGSRASSYVDLATTVTRRYQIIHDVASETHFFNTAEEAWRGAFRECVKLSSQAIHGQISNETNRRLKTWCNTAFHEFEHGEWVLKGANEGVAFGRSENSDLSLINDFDWLHQRYLGL